MTFASPLWLLALLPWTAVVAYLLWGRRRRVDVPFLALWPAKGDDAVRVRRRVMPPPLALALAILAMLLAILAAGRPGVPVERPREPLTVVIDRGWSVSAAGAVPGRHPIYEEAATLLGPGRPLEVWTVPAGGGEPVRANASALAAAALWDVVRPTGLDTRAALRAKIRERLGNTPGGVVVFTRPAADATGAGDAGERVVWVAPAAPARNGRVVRLAVRESPAVQAMVRLRGMPGLGSGKIRVTSGAATAEREVSLDAADDVDVFLDLPKLDAVVKAELLIADELRADDVAWLVREASWPRVEPRMPLPASLRRMLEVYARQRPPGDASRRVIVAPSPGDVPAGEPAVVLPPVDHAAAATRPARANALEVADHPVTRNLNWAEIGDVPLAPADPPAGWSPLVRGDGKVWVAVREEPIRAVWVGFDPGGEWARSSDYVVFWADVLNWAGAGGERFAAHPVGSLDGEWTAVELAPCVAPPEPKLWPGLYRRADGTLRALRAPDVTDAATGGDDWRERLARTEDGKRGRVDLSGVIALIALICLLGAAATWKRHSGVG